MLRIDHSSILFAVRCFLCLDNNIYVVIVSLMINLIRCNLRSVNKRVVLIHDDRESVLKKKINGINNEA